MCSTRSAASQWMQYNQRRTCRLIAAPSSSPTGHRHRLCPVNALLKISYAPACKQAIIIKYGVPDHELQSAQVQQAQTPSGAWYPLPRGSLQSTSCTKSPLRHQLLKVQLLVRHRESLVPHHPSASREQIAQAHSCTRHLHPTLTESSARGKKPFNRRHNKA